MVTISEKDIEYQLKRLRAVLKYAECISTAANDIVNVWYDLYLQKRKWYWIPKYSYEEFLNILSDDCDLRIVPDFSGYGTIIIPDYGANFRTLNKKVILKNTGITEDQYLKEKSLVLNSLNFLKNNKSTLYQFSDAINELSRINFRNKYSENYLLIFNKCSALIEEFNINVT